MLKGREALHSPNGILLYAHAPYGQINVVLSWSLGGQRFGKTPNTYLGSKNKSS